MKISWVDKISNEEMLAQVNETRTMLSPGYVLRHDKLLYGRKTYKR